MMSKMTPEERDAVLDKEKRKIERTKVVAAFVLIPLVLGFLLMRIQISNERVSGVMESVEVKHKATGSESRVSVMLDRGGIAEVVLPAGVPFAKGGRLEMTESTSILGSRRYTYPRLATGEGSQ